MKKLILYSLFSLSLFAVTSCGSDKEDEPKPTTIPVLSLTLDNTSITIEEGKTFTLTATVAPDNATDKTVSWTTSDAAVATVSDGKVSAVKEGEATITAKAGEKSTECKVSVKPITFTVTFDTDGGSEVSAQTVVKGKTATYPDSPQKENLYLKGWFLGDKEFDFSTAITSDITLKAHWWRPEKRYIGKPFSVSETKKVYFSSGNLQYHCKNKEWRFAPLQYDCIGSGNENISDDYDGYVDLFGWGTGNNPTLASENDDDYATFTDWGTYLDGGNVWHTLTNEEWKYLIKGRENASKKYGVAEVAGVGGVILLPDDWVLPKGLSFNSGVASEDGKQYYRTKNIISSGDWQKMESAGAVFFPASGYRFGNTLEYFGKNGYYWSSTADNNSGSANYVKWAHIMYFESDEFRAGYSTYRIGGVAVRLVRPL